MKENDINSIGEGETHQEPLQEKDKVMVTKRAGTEWKENMSDDEKQPFDQAAILKQEYELKKQNMGSTL